MTGDKETKKGFTLVELMVAITIFAIVLTGFVQLFSSAIYSQKESLNNAYILSNSSFLMEFLARNLRMAQKDISGVCISPKSNFEISPSGKDIKFLNYDKKCQEIYLENGKAVTLINGNKYYLVPENISVDNLKFKAHGGSQNDFFQPKITFTISLSTKNQPKQSITLQSTVSQRELDVKY